MKKSMLATLMVCCFVSPAMASNISIAEQKAIENNQENYNLIVKFKDKKIHESLLSTPETTQMFRSKNLGINSDNFAKKYNVKSSVSRAHGEAKIAQLASSFDINITHVRSLSFKTDLIRVNKLNGKKVNQLLNELMASGQIEDIAIDTVVKPMSFNDPAYQDQVYFQPKTSENPQGNNFEFSRLNSVNNLGRKIRIGVIDSGILPHEDVNDYTEGYDFLSNLEGEHQFERDDNPEDYVEYADGTSCSSQHGLSITSIIAANANNGIGMVGGIDSSQVEIIQARALACHGGANSDILDAVAWLSGHSVPGVPDISEKVDVINMSLGGPAIFGCTPLEQKVYDKAREAGVTVVVAAGNSSMQAQQYSPAGCNNVVTVGATDDIINDKASFSNFGEYVDVMAAGATIMSAWNKDFPDVKGVFFDMNYYTASGTSQASPQIAALIANLKMTTPDLTPDELESIVKSSTVEFPENSHCNVYGCGEGDIDAKKASNALSQVTTITDYTKEHRYEGYNTPAEETWLTQMSQYVETCDLVRLSWGNLGFERSGISYKLYQSIGGADMSFLQTVNYPQAVLNLADDTDIGVQACESGSCGNILTMSGIVTKPNSCI